MFEKYSKGKEWWCGEIICRAHWHFALKFAQGLHNKHAQFAREGPEKGLRDVEQNEQEQ